MDRGGSVLAFCAGRTVFGTSETSLRSSRPCPGLETKDYTNSGIVSRDATLRHATRLLDWTEDLSVAIFFALQGKVDQPCVWILNPFRLNLKSTSKAVIYDSADTLEHDSRMI